MASRDKLTQERLKELLRYDPAIGKWRWRVCRGGGARKGYLAGTFFTEHKGQDRYRRIMVDMTLYRACRLAFLYMNGRWPVAGVDHIDGNSTNDAWNNLRECDASQNAANVPKRRHNQSGYKGVAWNKYMRKYQALIKVHGISKGLGYFDRKENAALAYNFAAVEAFGDFARCNKAEV